MRSDSDLEQTIQARLGSDPDLHSSDIGVKANADKNTAVLSGASLEDAWLYTKIMAKLAANPDTPVRKINVDVTNGPVTLRGRVESDATKAAVERTPKEVGGVKRLTNLLKVQATD